ncbi:hypothetical protein BO94DRAFT_152620 [Aspergillus sclerotioniger CBS 115572]|uniref:Uncharacterized protein n=1 Tax=Aspergillus sclerotioniger CBS 115572 TaxID=1450535 RepID=A0A317W5M3_9EURO|nr:hypothetical protein BO94DRAFT_152620 [Aspergillus sclerotioniger CBS 115572]PWY80921.1 hypothetical protein BO94DRAFT_152620 [Aspergillus sclerotioniger CBS 115572]
MVASINPKQPCWLFHVLFSSMHLFQAVRVPPPIRQTVIQQGVAGIENQTPRIYAAGEEGRRDKSELEDGPVRWKCFLELTEWCGVDPNCTGSSGGQRVNLPFSPTPLSNQTDRSVLDLQLPQPYKTLKPGPDTKDSLVSVAGFA